MKKFIVFLGLIGMVLIITICLLSKFSKNTADFPHFKQAAIKYSGTVYGTIDEEFQLSFNFLDENRFSEMAQKDNIKEIYIVDEKKRVIPVNSWQINGASFTDYSIRNIHAKVVFNEKDNFILKKIVIKYIDDVSEAFDIGSLKVIVNTKYVDKSYVFNASQDLIISSNTTYSNFSGILISLGKLDINNIELTKIDLGIDGFGIDSENIRIIDKSIDNVNMDDLVKEFSSAKIVKQISTQINPVSINFNENDIVTLLIPLTVQTDKRKENNILVFNPRLTFNINGQEHAIFGDVNLVSTPSVSTESSQGDIDAKKIIEEFGL